MLSVNNSYERLSKKYLALTEISKTFPSRLELPELLEAVMKKTVSVDKQAGISALILWGQFTGLFQLATAFIRNYHSFFCPNQGISQENRKALITNIARTYASTCDSDSFHKISKQLQDSLMYLMKSQAVCA